MNHTLRRPLYLPFLNGSPGLHPGLAPISEANWLTPDSEARHLPAKHDLMRARRAEVYADAGAEAAADEAANLVMGSIAPDPNDWPTRLERAAASVSDDLCVMVREGDGWHLKAASLCAPSFWRLSKMIGRSLMGLHTDVPGAAPDLSQRITRIFDGLRPDMILERTNWTVQAGDARFTPDSAPLKAIAAETPDGDALGVLHLRVERQTIRKLPTSGALLFTIRVCIDPLRAALTRPANIQALRTAWRGIAPEMAVYKGWPAYDRLVSAALDQAGLALPATNP